MVAPYFRVARKFLGPSWLTTEGDGELLGYALDLLKDAFAERLRLGLLARFPQNDPTGQTTAPDDALAALGRDRGIVRGLNEPAQRYAVRLIRWLDDGIAMGSAFALMRQLAGYTGPGPAFRTVDVRGNWYSRDAQGNQSALLQKGNWDWDASPTALQRWARFWVIIYPNGLWLPGPTIGSGEFFGTPGRTIGSTATTDQVAAVRGIVAKWKPAGCRCVNIILAFDNTTFNPGAPRDGTGLPDGFWGNWAQATGTQYVPSRLASARYWDGVN